MIGVPMPDPRDSIINNLNEQLEAFFGAGNSVQVIPTGVSADAPFFGTNAHQVKLRAERDKLAPAVRAEAAKGGRMVGKTDPQAAAVEAMEEAGVQGEIDQTAIGAFRYAKRLRSGDVRNCVVAVFPLKVLIQLGAWPEAAERERRGFVLR